MQKQDRTCVHIPATGAVVHFHPRTRLTRAFEICRQLGLVLVSDRRGRAVAKPAPAGWL